MGDGLLLPLIVAVLITATASLAPTRHDRLHFWLGFVLGATAGAATQAAWLADDSPNLNWTLPAPHDFNCAGWYHAAFLTVISGLLLALATLAATRVRAARAGEAKRVEELASSPWLGALFAAAVTMVGLLIADNRDAADTTAGTATAVGVAFAVLIAGGLLVWTFGRHLRVAAANLAIGFGAACGATALATWGLAASLEVTLTTLAAAAIVALALSDLRPGRVPRLERAIPTCLVLLGGAAICYQLVDDQGLEAAIAIAVAAVAAVAMGGLRQERWEDEIVVVVSVLFVFGVLGLAAWLAGRPESQTEATLAVGGALVFLDALVIRLVSGRYADFMADVQEARGKGDKLPSAGARGDAIGTWALVAGLGIPALAALAVLVGEAAPSLGADDVAGGHPPGLTAWLIGDLVLLALTTIAVALALRHRKSPAERFRQGLKAQLSPVAAAICLLVSVAAVVLAATQLQAPLHDPAVAGVAALAVAVLVGEDLVRSSLTLQLAERTPLAWAVAVAGGATVVSGLFWLLTVGLWHGEQPASVGGALLACGVTLLPLGLCAGGFGVVVSAGLQTPHLTEQPPTRNTLWQQLMYAVLIFVAVAIPFFVVGRLEAHGDIANSGLVTLTSLGFMPALVGLVWWVLRMNAKHGQFESGHGDEVLNEIVDPTEAAEVNELRISALRDHVRFVNVLAKLLLVAGGLWIAVHAL